MSQPRGDYDRPNRQWNCGLEIAGTPCSAGPTCHGKCPSLGECVPIRQGDRWVCNRGENRGGPCEHGPHPDGRCCRTQTCKPTRSLRAIRGRWLRGAAIFTVGVVLILIGTSRRNELLVPGPLTSHHAQVIARADWENRCASCHPGANGPAADWLRTAIGGADGPGQSALCLKCHQDLATPGAEPMLAHGLPASAFPNRSAPVESSLVGLTSLGQPAHGLSASDPVACAACHQEHHGADHDLAAITDARCQACHTERYESFADGHPEFGMWPTTRRTRIRFNHASHKTTHYTKANKGFDCRACHLADETGDLTVRTDYHNSCAECHDADLVRSFDDGLPFLSLPTIDRERLAEAGIELPAWPPQVDGDFDGDVSPFTKLLLASDPKASEAIRTLGADFSFFDIDSDSPEQVEAAGVLVEAINGLLNDLQEEGHNAITARLERLTTSQAKTADQVAGMPLELIDRLQRTWFGGEPAPRPFDAIEDRRVGGGWYLDDEQLTLGYRPSGHDDPLIRSWLDAIVSLPDDQAELRDACLAEFTRPGAPGGCFECHSLETGPDNRLTINWRGRDRLDEPRGFTRFSHRPHLVQPELFDCSHCHQIDPTAELSTSCSGMDPSQFTSEFVPVRKNDCTSCHRPHAAGDSCTQCHNYHIEAPRSDLADAVEPMFRTSSDTPSARR